MNFKTLLNELRAAFRPDSLKQNRHRILPMLTVFPFLAALFGSWFLAGAFTLGCIFLMDLALRRYLNALAVRMEVKNSATWDVEVNKVKVGTITDAEYAAIRYRVFSDARPYYAQGRNVLRVTLNLFDYCYRAIPLGVFWVAVGLAVFAPDTFSETVSAIKHATSSELSQAASEAGRLLALTMVLVLVFFGAFGLSRFGFVNRFGDAIATIMRQRLAVPAEGVIVLSRWTPTGPMLTDEAASLRKRN